MTGKEKEVKENSRYFLFVVKNSKKQKEEFMEELKNRDKKGIGTKRKIEKAIYEVIVRFNENATAIMQNELTRIMLMELRRESHEER